ncbi:MAG: hypothetical protein ACPIFP_08825 [Candidatus Poseidoniaceae archaeon]
MDTANTAPFHTLDPIRGDLIEAVLEANETPSSEAAWEGLIGLDPARKERLGDAAGASRREEIPMDDATLTFVLSLERRPDGTRLEVADDRHTERFGRFPSGNGSLLTYLQTWMRPTPGQEHAFDDVMHLIDKLAMGIDQEHPSASEGHGGLRLHGWLDRAEIKDLRVGLMGRGWTVAADEPLDGGLRDAVKHLGAMLRGAERRGVGLLHRSHA